MCVAAKKAAVVGITGGIGAGKSTAARIFGLLGVPIYDADTAARRCLETDPALRAAVLGYFGPTAYKKTGTLNKAYVANRIFKDHTTRHWLNAQVHPAVKQDFQRWVQLQLPDIAYVLYEAALLFEQGIYTQLHRTLLVVAPHAVRMQRVLARDPHRKADEIQRIMATQLPEAQARKLVHKDNILQNDSRTLLIPQVTKVHQEILSEIYTYK